MTKPVYAKGILLGEGIPKICVPLTGITKESILAEAEKAREAGADLVEWRMDFWEESDKKKYLEEILFSMSCILKEMPLIFTIRSREEGGLFSESEEEYETLNMIAAASGVPSLIDIEVFSDTEKKKDLIARIRKKGVLCIASYHDFEKTESYEALLKRFLEMEQTDADILKLAMMPENFDDAAELMKAAGEMRKRTTKPLIAISMGSSGAVSRIAGEFFGSCITFGTAGDASAPGQPDASLLRTMIETLHRRHDTKKSLEKTLSEYGFPENEGRIVSNSFDKKS